MPTENPQFDHLLHWVPDVPAAAAEYTAAGLPAEAGDAQFGFQHGAWRMDERYIEILTITDKTAFRAHPFAKAWTVLDAAASAADARGGGAITFAIDVVDAAATAERLRTQGHEILDSSIYFDEIGIGFQEVFVLDGPPWAPFFITYSPVRSEILRGLGDDHPYEPGEYTVATIEIETPDPTAACAWLSTLTGLPAEGDRLPLPGGAIHFRPGAADRITTLQLNGPQPLETSIAGLTYRCG